MKRRRCVRTLKIRAFNVAGRDVAGIRVSADWYWDYRRNLRRVVPVRAFAVRPSINFQKLGEVNIGPEVFFDGGNVTPKPVRSDLKSARDTLAQVPDKIVGTNRISLCHEVRENEFAFQYR